MEDLGVETGHVVKNLEILNERVAKQMSPWRVFRDGVIYGTGFIVGSTILTALVVTIVLKFFPDTIFGAVIAWIARSR